MFKSPGCARPRKDTAGAAAHGAMLIILAAIILPQAVGGLTLSYRGGVNYTCPCLSVSTNNLSTVVNVTMTSSVQSDNWNSSSSYCSAALASGATMNSSIAVFDCYELGGNVTVGASRNFVNGTLRDNVDDPLLRRSLSNLVARKENATLVCSLSFNASALISPSLDKLFILLAEGALSNTSSALSPKKSKHKWRAALPATDLLQSLTSSNSSSSLSSSSQATAASSAFSTTMAARSSATANSGVSSVQSQVWGLTLNYRGGANSTCPCLSVSTNNLSTVFNVTLTSSVKSAGGNSSSSSSYCSAALASGETMNSSIAVFDCYELGGNVTVGASRNLVNGTLRDNVDDPLLRRNLSNLVARKENATLVCSLSFNASALISPRLDMLFILLAEGALSNTSLASSPKKSKHTLRAALPATDLLQSLTSSKPSLSPSSSSLATTASSASSTTVAARSSTTANSGASNVESQVAVALAVVFNAGAAAFAGFKAAAATA